MILLKGNTNLAPQPTQPRSSAFHSRRRWGKVPPQQSSDSDEADDDSDDEDNDDSEVHIDNKLLGQLINALQMISTCGTIPHMRRPHHHKSRANEDLLHIL